MTWHVQYRKDTVDLTTRHLTPEQAIESACSLIEAGWDVYGLGTGPLSDSIDRAHIDRIYALWARDKHPFT